MNRRQLLLCLAATALPVQAAAYAPITYAPATWREMRETSGPVILNFRASWSLTCQIKQDILAQLLAENPRYQALTFMEVDWDTFGPSQWTSRLKVERHSTLLAMKSGRETARIVAQPYPRKLRAFLDSALTT